MLKRKSKHYSKFAYKLEVYLQNTKRPLTLLLDSEQQLDKFYTLLNETDDSNIFFKFGQLIFNRNLIKYALYEEIF